MFQISSGNKLVQRSLSVVFLILVSFNLSSCSSAEGDLIGEMIVAYGGEDNLKKLNSYKAEWDMVNMMTSTEGSAVVYLKFPDKFRVEVTGGMSGFETRVINGVRSGKGVRNRPISEESGPMASATKFQLRRLYTPLMLREIQPMLKLEDYKEGDKYMVLTHNQGQGMFTIRYYVNPKTKLLDKVVGSLPMDRRTIEFAAEYGDYRKVGGVMMHHTENKFAANMNTAFLTLKNITLNAAIEPGLFKIN